MNDINTATLNEKLHAYNDAIESLIEPFEKHRLNIYSAELRKNIEKLIPGNDYLVIGKRIKHLDVIKKYLKNMPETEDNLELFHATVNGFLIKGSNPNFLLIESDAKTLFRNLIYGCSTETLEIILTLYKKAVAVISKQSQIS